MGDLSGLRQRLRELGAVTVARGATTSISSALQW